MSSSMPGPARRVGRREPGLLLALALRLALLGLGPAPRTTTGVFHAVDRRRESRVDVGHDLAALVTLVGHAYTTADLDKRYM